MFTTIPFQYLQRQNTGDMGFRFGQDDNNPIVPGRPTLRRRPPVTAMNLPDLPTARPNIEPPPLQPTASTSTAQPPLPTPPLAQSPQLAPAPVNPSTIAPPRAMTPPSFTPDPLRDYRGEQIGSETDLARDQYVRRGGTTDEQGNFRVKRSGKDILRNIALGFLQGAAADPRNPLMSGLGGAAAGGTITAINPMVGREYSFNTMDRPRMDAAEQERRQRAEYERAVAMDELRRRDTEARVAANEADLKDRPIRAEAERLLREKQLAAAEAQRARAENPIGEAAWGTYDTRTGQPIWQRPQATRPPSLADAEADRAAEEGSVEEIAASSTDARRDEIIASLPPRMRDILTKGTYETESPAVDADGNVIPGQTVRQQATPTDKEMMEAQQAYDRAYDRIYRQNLGHTKGVARRKAAERRGGQSNAPHAKSPGSRNVNELSTRYPGIDFTP